MTQDRPRRLAAVWFADIVGYTDISARDEDLALRVVRELQRVSKKHCQARGGRVVKLMGDAVLTVFDSVDGAVRAALGLRDEFLGSEEAIAAGVSIRIGVHVGEVADAPDGDVYGDAVNVASRIERVAEPGQVVVSHGAHALLQQRTAIEFEDLGESELKGIPGPIRLYSAELIEELETAGVRELLQDAIAPLQLLDIEGVGGMGEIYLARDPGLRRTLAVKVLRSELVADREARSRFHREATVIAGLSHPNVITIHSVGELKDETPYFVMDYIQGGSLADRLEEEGLLPVPQVRRILGEVASALQAAHSKGIVHRDIKAANVLWDLENGRALVTDWGIASLDPTVEMAPETRLTKTGMFIGSPHYMSPEQLAGDEIGPETDVYGLGLLAFELLTGQGPFLAETPRAIMISHLREDPPKLAEGNPEVDHELDSLVERCLAKSPTDRPRAGEIAQRLAPGTDATLEWPPPGTERLRPLTKAVFRNFGLGILCWIVSTYLMFGSASQTWAGTLELSVSSGVVGLAGLGLFGAGLWSLWVGARHARRANRLGYGWGTLVDVIANHRGDTGVLLAGKREYAALTPAQRRRIQLSRRVALGFQTLAVLVAIPSSLFFVGLLDREALQLGMSSLLPLFLLGLAVAGFAWYRLRESVRLWPVRRSLHKKAGQVGFVESLIRPWHETLALVGGALQLPLGPKGHPWVASASLAVVGFGILSGVLLTFPVLSSGAFGTLTALITFPKYSRTLELLSEVQGFEHLVLPPDTSLSEEQASKIAWGLISSWPRNDQFPQAASEYRLPEWNPDEIFGEDNPMPPFHEIVDSIMRMGAEGLTEEQKTWIIRTTDHPVFDAFSRVSRAPSLDLSTQYFGNSFPDTMSFQGFATPSLGKVREMIYWKWYRAAVALGEGQVDEAEKEMLETLSFGFLLLGQSDLIENLIGRVFVNSGRNGLVQIYSESGRVEEVREILGSIAELDTVDVASQLAAPNESPTVFAITGEQMALEIIRNPDAPPGIRWEMLGWMSWVSPCMGPSRILFGPGPSYAEALEIAKSELVQTSGGSEWLRVIEETGFRRQQRISIPIWARPIYSLSRISGALMRNERIPACTAIVLEDWTA